MYREILSKCLSGKTHKFSASFSVFTENQSNWVGLKSNILCLEVGRLVVDYLLQATSLYNRF